jgi:hypothetical protein
MEKETVQVSATFEKELRNAIQEHATRQKRSFSSMLEIVAGKGLLAMAIETDKIDRK